MEIRRKKKKENSHTSQKSFYTCLKCYFRSFEKNISQMETLFTHLQVTSYIYQWALLRRPARQMWSES